MPFVLAALDAPAAFRRRLLEALPRLRRYARTLAHDSHDADDLTQLTLERALARWAQFDPERDLAVWLLSIAHNAFLDGRRRDARLQVTDPEDMVRLQDEGNHSHSDPGLRLDLQAALARLGADQREALLLVCVEQMSYAEVAQVLGLPLGTVMSRVCRARVALRQHLEAPATRPAPGLRRVV